MITIRFMNEDELGLAADIDVSESGSAIYQCVAGQLKRIEQTWQRADWSAETWQENLADWAFLGRDVILGAFADDHKLVGMAILGYHKTATMAQLVSIHVSRAYHRRGIGSQLLAKLVQMARDMGKTEMYVWATNSQAAVEFYLNQGFQPVQPGHAFYRGDIEDIPMIKML